MKEKEKLVLFTQLSPSMWQYKTARTLRKKSCKTALICLKSFNKNYETAFDEIISLNLKNLKPLTIFKKLIFSPLTLPTFLIKLLTIKPKIAICEAPPHYLSAFFIWLFKRKCKTIYFPYDMISSRFKHPEKFQSKRELWGEKYAFQKCDAILCKSDLVEFDLLPKNLQKSIQNKPKLAFQPYALNQFFIHNKKKNKEAQIVYAGGYTLYQEVLKNRHPLYRDMSEYFYEILKQGFHLHFYSARAKLSKQDKERITKNEEQLLKRLHVHEHVSLNRFAEELAKYDYGLDVFFFSDAAKKGIFSATTKFAFYLEAGIPIIINKERRLFSELIKKNKIGIVTEDYNLKDLKEKIKKAKYRNLVKNVYKFREQYSVENHINELINFFNKLIES